LPVRVALDMNEMKEHPLRIGLSLEVTADLSNQKGALINSADVRSPQYTTDIYQDEESGVNELITSIIATNMDPNLKKYLRASFALHNILLEGK